MKAEPCTESSPKRRRGASAKGWYEFSKELPRVKANEALCEESTRKIIRQIVIKHLAVRPMMKGKVRPKHVHKALREGDKLLLMTAEVGVECLKELKSPGCKWLDLCKEAAK